MQKTKYFKLNKPQLSDFANIEEAINPSMDIIDTKLKELEDEILNLQAGESKTVLISPSDGVGKYREDAVQILPKEQFAGIDLAVGMELFGQGEHGESVRVIVKSIGEDDVTVDFNHPYAGKDLEFKVQIFDRRDATPDEIASGMVAGAHTCGCGGHDHDHHHGEGGCCGHGHHEHGHHHGDGGCGCH